MINQKRNGSSDYQMITPPNNLKAKVGPGKGVDAQTLERAQALVNEMAGDFELRAADEADHILKLAEIAETDASEERMVDIFRIGHELKGQGGTFGYPLITKIGGSLCRYIELVGDDNPIDLEVIRAHALALRAVAGNKIAGDGGPVEKRVLGELERLLSIKVAS